jgi:hypothetical protein
MPNYQSPKNKLPDRKNTIKRKKYNEKSNKIKKINHILLKKKSTNTEEPDNNK